MAKASVIETRSGILVDRPQGGLVGGPQWQSGNTLASHC